MRIGELTARLTLDSRQFNASLKAAQANINATTATFGKSAAAIQASAAQLDVSRAAASFGTLGTAIRSSMAGAQAAVARIGARVAVVSGSIRAAMSTLGTTRAGAAFNALAGRVSAAMGAIQGSLTRAMAGVRAFGASVANMSARAGAAVLMVATRFGRMGQNMRSLGEQMRTAGGNLTRALTVPIALIGGAAVIASARWETAMVGVAKTVDATRAELEQLGREFVSLSEQIPVSSNALANLGAAAGQLGISLPNIRGFVEVMAALGVSTNLSAEEAATALARLANITQMPQNQFDRLGSTVVALGNNLATTEREIVDMGLRIAKAGATVGITEPKILALAGALSSIGVRAEAGGTAISRVIIEIAAALDKGGARARQFAAVAGMSVESFKRAFQQDAADAVVTFIEGLGRLNQQGKSTFGILDELSLSDVRVRDALLGAASAGDLFRRALILGSRAWDENRALTEEAAKFYSRLAGQFGLLRNKLVNIAAEFGTTLKPAIEDAIGAANRILDALRKAVEWFGKLDESTRKTVIAIAAITAAAGPAVTAIGAITAALGAMGTVAAASAATVSISFTTVAASMKTLTVAGAAIAGMAALWVAAFASVGVAVYQAIRYWDGLVVSTKQAFARIGAAVSQGIAVATRRMAEWAASIANVSRVLSDIPGLEAFGLAARGADAAVGSLNRAADTAQRAADRTSALVDVYGRAYYAVNILKDAAKEFGIPEAKLNAAIQGIKTLEDAVEQGRLSPEKFNQFLTATEASFIAWGKRLKAEAEKAGQDLSLSLEQATSRAFEKIATIREIGIELKIPQAKIDAAVAQVNRALSQFAAGEIDATGFTNALGEIERHLRAIASAPPIGIDPELIAVVRTMQGAFADLAQRVRLFGDEIDVPAEQLRILGETMDKAREKGATFDTVILGTGLTLGTLSAAYQALRKQIDQTAASTQYMAQLQQFATQAIEAAKTPAAQYRDQLARIEEAGRAGFLSAFEMAVVAFEAFKTAVAGLKGLGKEAEEIAVILGTTLDQIQNALDQLGTRIGDNLTDIQRNVRMIAVGVGQQIVMGIVQGVRDFGDLLKNIIISVISAAVSIGLRSALGIGSPSKLGIYAGEQVTLGVAVGIQDSARSMIGNAARSVGDAISNSLGSIPDQVAGQVGDMAGAFRGVGRVISDEMSGAFGGVGGAIVPAFKRVGEQVSGSISNALDSATAGIAPAVSEVAALPGKIGRAVGAVTPALAEVGRMIPEGVEAAVGGIGAAFTRVAQLPRAMADGVSTAAGTVKGAFADIQRIPHDLSAAASNVSASFAAIGQVVPAGLALDSGALTPAFGAAAAGVTPNIAPVAAVQSVRVDLSDMPAPLTPEAQAVDARWQRVLTETLRAVNKRGYRDG